MKALEPVPAVAALRAYAVPPPAAPCDLLLAGNEGLPPPPGVWDSLNGTDPEVVRRYPKVGRLQAKLSARHSAAEEQVLVCAGADDALDRACRALLGPGRRVVLPLPTFEMLHVYAKLTGAGIDTVPWPSGGFPTDEVIAALTDDTVMVAMVSPNNPTGAVASADDLRAIAAQVPLVLLDHAYVEFADDDLTGLALELGNVLVFRTLSKAWGLAGLRTGYVVGPAPVVEWLGRVGLPYPVAGPSVALAEARLDAADGEVTSFIAAVKRRRRALEERLAPVAEVPMSQANFVFARFSEPSGAHALRDALAYQGIAIRGWPGRPDLEACLRITVPCSEADHERLMSALDRILEAA